MYLFTRRTRLAPGHYRDGMEWALSVTEKVNQITGLPVRLWSSVYSPAVGSISWGTFVESLTDLEAANAKLAADDVFVDLANKGADVTVGGIDDMAAQVLHMDADANTEPSYVTVVRSQLANGAFQRGVEVGIEIAQRASQLGGLPTAFMIAATGRYAEVAWITGAESLKQLEGAEQAVNSNPEFIQLLDEKASSCYLPGVTEQIIWQRVG